MSVATTAYISNNGLVFLFFTTGSPPVFTNATAHNSDPSFFQNGSGTPLANVQGPFWQNTTHNDPWVAYQLPTTPISSDTLTFSASIGWFTTAGGAAPAATTQTVANYLGRLEPAVGYYSGLGPASNQTLQVPGFDDTTRALQLGFNSSWNAQALQTNPVSWFQSWLKRGAPYWTNVVDPIVPSPPGLQDSRLRPVTIKGAATLTPVTIASGDAAIDARHVGTPTGDWVLVVDETNPGAHAMVVTITTNAVATCSVVTTAGTIDGEGVERGKKYTASIAYASNPPSDYQITITITVKSWNNAYNASWTLENEALFAPNADGTAADTTHYTDDGRLDPAIFRFFQTPSDKYPCCLRWVDATIGIIGVSNVVIASHLRNLSDYSWKQTQQQLIVTCTTIQPYDLTTSPKIFCDQPHGNTFPSDPGDPAPYYFAPSTTYWSNPSGATPATGSGSWWFGEAVTATDHGFHTGQTIAFGATGMTGIQITNGNFVTPVTVSLNNGGGSLSTPIWVTASNRFVFLAFSAAATHPLPGPQFINQVFPGTPTTVTGTATVLVPDAGSVPYEAVAYGTGQIPRCDLWLNIPVSATDDCVAEIAARVLANFPAGRRIWVELANEAWNNITPNYLCTAYGALGAIAGTPITRPVYYCLRAAQVAAVVRSVFAAAGRGAEVKLVIGAQFDSAVSLYINAINSANGLSPTVPVEADAIATAPYVFSPTDSTLALGCASIYSDKPTSIAFGTAQASFPWTRGQWLDVLRHHLKYTSLYNGPTGYFQAAISALNNYVPVGSQSLGFRPILVGYEGEIQRLAPPIATSGNLHHIATHDLFFDPQYHPVGTTLYQLCQFGGMSFINIYACVFQRSVGTTNTTLVNQWGNYTWGRQLPGYGDGRNGSTTNALYDFTLSHAQDYVNASVRGQAWLDWADKANRGPDTSSSGRRALRYVPGLSPLSRLR